MTRWHRGEAEKSWQRLTVERGRQGQQPKETRGAGGVSGRTDTAVVDYVDEGKNEMADRVARYQFDYVERVLLLYI